MRNFVAYLALPISIIAAGIILLAWSFGSMIIGKKLLVEIGTMSLGFTVLIIGFLLLEFNYSKFDNND